MYRFRSIDADLRAEIRYCGSRLKWCTKKKKCSQRCPYFFLFSLGCVALAQIHLTVFTPSSGIATSVPSRGTCSKKEKQMETAEKRLAGNQREKNVTKSLVG